MMGHCKEVEEWLMGSGESAETAASQGLKGTVLFKLMEQKTSENVPHQPKIDKDEDQPEIEDWMFKTFSKNKNKQAVGPSSNQIREEDQAKQTQVESEDPFMDNLGMNKRIEPNGGLSKY